MTTKELTALGREAFGDDATIERYGCIVLCGRASVIAVKNVIKGRTHVALLVCGGTRAEAEARFVACLRAIKEIKP